MPVLDVPLRLEDYGNDHWGVMRADVVAISVTSPRRREMFLDGESVPEGPGWELHAIADAIESGTDADFKRIAVVCHAGGVDLWSPRNSDGPTTITRERALELAALIRKTIPRK